MAASTSRRKPASTSTPTPGWPRGAGGAPGARGALNAPPEARVDLDTDPRLAAGVRVVAGDPRVRYLHTEPDAAADVQAAWGEVLDGWAQVYSREQAVSTGMFGPVNPRHLARIGDVVVVCTGDAAVLATGHEPVETARLIGFHGAATAAEMAIPVIVFTSLLNGSSKRHSPS